MAGFQQIQNEDKDIEKRPFDGPVPGQSLTDEPGSRTWEGTPDITDPDEAVLYVVDKFEGSKKTQSAYSKLMLAGLPVESIVNTISFGGFMEGKWTVDVAEIIKPPLTAFFIAYADEHDIPYKVFNNPNELTDDGIPDDQVLSLMADRNPEAFAQLQEEANMQQQDAEIQDQGFLAPPPMAGGEEEMMPEQLTPPVEEPAIPMGEI